MNVIVSGSIGRLPIGGHAWVDMQYLASLAALGHNVFYLEECGEGSWVYNWDTEEVTTDMAYPANYVRDCLTPLGLGERWIYRAGDSAAGMSLEAFLGICADADLLLVRAVPVAKWRREYAWARRRLFIDADPGFTQIRILEGQPDLCETVARCEALFTIAQRLGASDCLIPTACASWSRTLPPVALSFWPTATNSTAARFTSIMQWRGFHDVTYEGVEYGQKDREFPRFIDLPRRTSQPMQLALTGSAPEKFVEHGWEVLPGWVPSRTPCSYRSFIQESRAEFGVAKHGYVKMRGGWFSDRSVCYLASGRPVLVQDTGLDDWLPTGEGVVTFRDLPGAVAGIDKINADYERHRRAARRVAEEYFAPERVLQPLLEAAMA
jgi:hypothetical protein